jgi:alkanesulfonate monooxygenase SsuD/methylene tetrahydromethanopterin reductase-like flavin-dependent oxidoreductase (luciferase family)
VGGGSRLCLVLGAGPHDSVPRVGAPEEPFLEGWTVLAALAAVTSRIRLATLCTAVGYRNPAHLAKIAATVDLISRARLTLGIGAGFFEDEYRTGEALERLVMPTGVGVSGLESDRGDRFFCGEGMREKGESRPPA